MMTADFRGRMVTHQRFGPGSVGECVEGRMTVTFPEYGERKFVFPGAFEQYLSTEDGELAAAVAEALERLRSEAEAEAARQKRQAFAAELSAATPSKKPRKAPARVKKTVSR